MWGGTAGKQSRGEESEIEEFDSNVMLNFWKNVLMHFSSRLLQNMFNHVESSLSARNPALSL